MTSRARCRMRKVVCSQRFSFCVSKLVNRELLGFRMNTLDPDKPLSVIQTKQVIANMRRRRQLRTCLDQTRALLVEIGYLLSLVTMGRARERHSSRQGGTAATPPNTPEILGKVTVTLPHCLQISVLRRGYLSLTQEMGQDLHSFLVKESDIREFTVTHPAVYRELALPPPGRDTSFTWHAIDLMVEYMRLVESRSAPIDQKTPPPFLMDLLEKTTRDRMSQ